MPSKSKIILLCCIAVLLGSNLLTTSADAQVIVDSSYSVDSLVNNVLLGSCVVVENVSYKGAISAIGNFNAVNTNIGLDEGIIISTGSIANARGPNDNPGKSTEFNTAGDADLSSIAGVETNDAAVLEFDFISSSDTVKFNYVFASEEYPEFVGGGFNDVFVFYVSGPGITGQQNIALIPGTITPVTIDNVNDATNLKYYVNNSNGSTIQYDGFTIPLEAKIGVIPGETYHMKIAIADAGVKDFQTDSGVFLEAGSFRSGERITVETLANPVEGCRNGIVRISRKEDATDTLIVDLIISGSAVPGVDYVAFPTTVMLLPGQFETQFAVTAVQDMFADPNEKIIITLDNKCIGTDPSVDIMDVLEDGLDMNMSPDTNICAGSSTMLHAIVLDGEAPFIYSWVPKNSLDDPTSPTPVATPATTTLYTVTVLDSYGCSSVGDVWVYVDDLTSRAGDNIRICYGAEGMIGEEAVGGQAPYSYKWTPAEGLTADTVAATVASPLVTTQYVLEVTGLNGCVDYDTIVVEVGDELLVSAGNDSMVCRGTSALLRANVSGGRLGYLYRWTPAESLDNPSLATPTASPDVPTTYQVEVTDLEGCKQYDSVFLDINELNADAGEDKQICAGASIVIGGQPRNGIGPYDFDWSPTNGLSNSSDQFPIASPLVTTQYVVRVQDSFGCSSSDTVVVTVGDVIKPLITAEGSTDLCEGQTLVLSATTGYSGYQWSNGASGQTITVANAGSITVTVTDNFGCSGTSDSLVIVMHPLPEPDIAGPASVCLNSTPVYTANVTPGNTYTWAVQGGNILSGQNSSSITVDWTQYGNGTVELTETAGQTGCSETISFIVNVADELSPSITIDRPGPFCAGDTVVLSAESGYAVYTWSSGETTESITVSNPGSYSVYVELDPQCTGSSDPIAVSFEPLPQPVITALGPTVFCEGDSVELDAGNGYVFYQWSTGQLSQTIFVSQAGPYTVEVVNASGCRGVSAPLDIMVTPMPAKPSITRSIDTLISTPADSYQWYRNDTLLTGSVGQIYVMRLEGVYTVRISDATGCTALSDPFDVRTPLATSTITIPMLVVEAGERFSLPVLISASENLKIASVDEFEMTLRFNRSILYPVDETLAGTMDGEDMLLELSGVLGQDTLGLLTQTEFIAMLGPVDRTAVSIEQFRWVDNFVRIIAQDGEVLLSICTEGGERTFDDGSPVALRQNHPNPFNAMTVLRYSVIERGYTELFVLDLHGRVVARLVQDVLEPGSYSARFDASMLASGSYIAVLRTPTMMKHRTMEVLK
jgi:PKD domain-containing protein